MLVDWGKWSVKRAPDTYERWTPIVIKPEYAEPDFTSFSVERLPPLR